MTGWLEPVHEALDRVPARVEIFFRDDDAGWRDDRLRSLIDLFARHELPLDLAVIPAELTPRLARELRARTANERVGLHQHGFAHRNHEPEGRPCEFGPSRTRAAQMRDIAAGRQRLEALLHPLVQPIFTPPWNRCSAATGECLLELGFAALSREWRAEPLALEVLEALEELPIRVDWLARRRGVRLSRTAVGRRLAEALHEPGPVGIMLHHAELDGGELDSLDRLLALLAFHPAVSCLPLSALLGRVAA